MRISSLVFRILLLVSCVKLTAQIHNPVTWNTSVLQTENKTVTLVAKASIEKGWHLYAQNIEKGGPIPTTFYYPDHIALIDDTIEDKGIVVFDDVFEMNLKYFENQATFKQKITLDTGLKEIKASVEFMACNDGMCLPPKEVSLLFDLTNISINDNIKESEAIVSKNEINVDAEKEKQSYLILFILSFIAGLTALFTPCVFPMIPMTVSFFTKQSKSKAVGVRNAMIYGISIIVIYVLLGTAVVGVFGASALNELSTSVPFNIIFFVILMLFAFAFLGAYELVLPSSWGTKLDEKADQGGLIGIFFMALALAVVSFSCTGPIVGTALVEAASHGGIGPIVAMFGFSSAIALPFTLFAIFPGWMNSLPKSGGWLNTVKVVLGFLELALAFKFLSNADLVLQAHWLEREVFIAIWLVVFALLGFYLLGKIRLPHDYQPIETLSVSRLVLAMISFVFVLYLLPGLFGAPVKLVGAFVPPQEYSESPYGLGSKSESNINHDDVPEGAHLLAPYDVLVFKDYDLGLKYAEKVNKPVLLDFSGYACVNCRKMEQNVWSSPEVLSILQNDVVVISLYVDDRQAFDEQELSPKTGKPYRYKGQKWAHFQEVRYKTNAQPYYVVLDKKGVDISSPIGYTPNVKKYKEWLLKSIQSAQ